MMESVRAVHVSPHPQGPRRFPVLALALLQFIVFAALPVADAVLEARGRSTVAHVEAEGSEHCETGHNHLLCQLTRTFSSGISTPVQIDLRLVFETSLAIPTATAWENRPTPSGGSGPRAPPSA